jgi:hypothetical protein
MGYVLAVVTCSLYTSAVMFVQTLFR